MNVNNGWLDVDFILKTPVWIIAEKESYNAGEGVKSLYTWIGEPLLGAFQPMCLSKDVAIELAESKNLVGYGTVLLDDVKSKYDMLNVLTIIGVRNVAIYFGKNDVRFFQTIHLTERLDRER